MQKNCYLIKIRVNKNFSSKSLLIIIDYTSHLYLTKEGTKRGRENIRKETRRKTRAKLTLFFVR
jgi:hypothetical protein